MPYRRKRENKKEEKCLGGPTPQKKDRSSSKPQEGGGEKDIIGGKGPTVLVSGKNLGRIKSQGGVKPQLKIGQEGKNLEIGITG